MKDRSGRFGGLGFGVLALGNLGVIHDESMEQSGLAKRMVSF